MPGAPLSDVTVELLSSNGSDVGKVLARRVTTGTLHFVQGHNLAGYRRPGLLGSSGARWSTESYANAIVAWHETDAFWKDATVIHAAVTRTLAFTQGLGGRGITKQRSCCAQHDPGWDG